MFNPFGAPSNTFGAPPSSSQQPLNPFGAPSVTTGTPSSLTSTSSPFGAPSTQRLFGAPSTQSSFGAPSTPSSLSQNTLNPFGAPSTNGTPSAVSQQTSNPFGGSSTNGTLSALQKQAPSPFGTPSTTNGVFGAPSEPKSNPFGTPYTTNSSFFGAPSESKPNPFGTPSTTNGTSSSFFRAPNESKPNSFLQPMKPSTAPTNSRFPPPKDRNAGRPLSNGSTSKPQPPAVGKGPKTSEALERRIQEVLKNRGVRKPTWPSVEFKDDPEVWETYTKDYREFSNQYRRVLIEAGVIDDPEVPKRLEHAIIFKGTCDTMCPEQEIAERIVERRYDQFEKKYFADGSFSTNPDPQCMVKKLARSAAGQDAPLPMEVRTVSALKRSLDYLIDDVLGNMDLAAVHGFIWDRTRAIRRDLVFHTFFTTQEMLDKVYILENSVRFHIVALHQMSKKEVNAVDFVEQQEHEQLGKTFTSLKHAYEDCATRKIKCENEFEFRAYYLLFNRRDPRALSDAQDWGWEIWSESEEFQIALSLVEAYQNAWDTHGPLVNPATNRHTQLDIALCAFSKFFSIVEDSSVSYHMACFAEICFNDIRKSTVQTILKAYRRQKNQTNEWTLSKLNAYLRFDDEADILAWGEQHGLHFESDNDQEYLSFDKSVLRDAWPEVRQQFSYQLVERKRGNHTLQELIHTTVLDENEVEEEDFVVEEDDVELFVEGNAASLPEPAAMSEEEDAPEPIKEVQQPINKELGIATQTPVQIDSASAEDSTPKQMSIFDRFGPPKTGSTDFFTSTPKEEPQSIFTKPPGEPTASVFTQPAKQQPSVPPKKALFGFLSEPSPTVFTTTAKPAIPSDALISSGQQPITAPPVESRVLSEDQPETTGPTDAPLSLAISDRASLNQDIQNPLFNTTPQARPASPASIPSKSTLANSPVADLPLSSAPNPIQNSTKPPKTIAITNWMVKGKKGILEEFIDWEVPQMLQEVFNMWEAEEQQKAEQKAEEQARIEAEQFRYRTLTTKYFLNWREAARRLGLKRRGREARKARKELAESMRATKAAEKANLVEDFRASTTTKRRESRERRESLESLLDETGVLDGVHDPEEKLRAIVKEEVRAAMKLDRSNSSSKKRLRSEQSSNSMIATNGHKRGRSDNPLGRSLLSDPTYLNGGSRIHLLSNYDDQDERRHQVSGVQTDYFRLKARGITTLHNGAPLANSAAKDITHQKHSFDGITKSTMPRESKVREWARSIPPKAPELAERLSNVEYEENPGSMKSGINGFLKNEKKSKQKRVLDDDDEELFARAKRIREQMDEGAEWFRKQILKHKSRSSS